MVVVITIHAISIHGRVKIHPFGCKTGQMECRNSWPALIQIIFVKRKVVEDVRVKESVIRAFESTDFVKMKFILKGFGQAELE